MLRVSLVFQVSCSVRLGTCKDSSGCLADLLLCRGLSLLQARLPQLQLPLPGCRHCLGVRLVSGRCLSPERFQHLSAENLIRHMLQRQRSTNIVFGSGCKGDLGNTHESRRMSTLCGKPVLSPGKTKHAL